MPSGSVSWQALRRAPPARAVTGWGRAAGGSRWQAGRSCDALCWGPGPWVYPRGTAPGVTWCCGGSAQRLQAERPRRDCACAARHLVPWPWRGWIGPLQTGMSLSPSVWQGLALATSFEGTVPSPVLPFPCREPRSRCSWALQMPSTRPPLCIPVPASSEEPSRWGLVRVGDTRGTWSVPYGISLVVRDED